jgi:hypothetical protein
VILQPTSVGLDVHARSVVGCGLDGQTGELFERRLIPDHGQILRWLRSLPGPVAVTYEAGPTEFGLARFLVTENITCLVAAPSKPMSSTHPGDHARCLDLRSAAAEQPVPCGNQPAHIKVDTRRNDTLVTQPAASSGHRKRRSPRRSRTTLPPALLTSSLHIRRCGAGEGTDRLAPEADSPRRNGTG